MSKTLCILAFGLIGGWMRWDGMGQVPAPVPTKQDVINEYKAPFARLREHFRTLAGHLPAVGRAEDRRERLNLSPRPIFDKPKETYNTEIVMVEELTDPDVSFGTPARFRWHGHGWLLHCLQWTGPKNPLRVGGESAGDFARRFEEALRYRYLIILRVIEYDRPTAVDERTFRGGYLRMEGFLVGLDTGQILTSFHVSARAETDLYQRLSHLIKSKDRPEERMDELERLANSSLYSKVEEALTAVLTEITDGTFNFALV